MVQKVNLSYKKKSNKQQRTNNELLSLTIVPIYSIAMMTPMLSPKPTSETPDA